MSHEFSIRVADWAADEADIRAIRETVFVREQNVPVEMEWDGLDADCIQVIAFSQDKHAIGTGRLLPDGRIGRMAVLAEWRCRGVGTGILTTLLAIASQHRMPAIILHAQTTALSFYAAHGFVQYGAEFDEAGISHYAMRLELAPP